MDGDVNTFIINIHFSTGGRKMLIISFSTFKKEADITTITIFRMVQSVGIFFLITECRI